MAVKPGKYERKPEEKNGHGQCLFLIFLSFFLLECFAFLYLTPQFPLSEQNFWPLAFGGLWAVILCGFLCLLPRKGSRVLYGVIYSLSLVYAVGQTGYYQLFSEMIWLSEFRYASEGSDYFDILQNYPVDWFLWIVVLLITGILLLWKYPRFSGDMIPRIAAIVLAAVAAVGTVLLPEEVFERDGDIRYAQSDYGRMQSAEAAYENMFNVHRLYQVCGMYQTLAKDVYSNLIYPLTPDYRQMQETSEEMIESYFQQEALPASKQGNAMTGILKDKNVVLVLMESMDDWMIGEHTPTIQKLMAEGINFVNFYTPPYGGIRTFNTEFCINTGSFLSSQGGYAFDYVTNEYNQSLAFLLRQQGYSAKLFHYNNPSFYSRDVFSEVLGYEDYVYYADYLGEYTEKEKKQLLYDDLILFREPSLRQMFFRDAEKTLNFVITRSAHLSYKYNEVLSHWGLQKYPEYLGLTDNEETDCALLKARLVDDFFRELLVSLEEEGRLDNTVIIGVTDHYTYGYKDEKSLMELSGVTEKLLLEKTPCFIWSPGLDAMEMTKTLNTADFLPTVLNLLGVESSFSYMGQDAFDEAYEGYALFSDGSWITSDVAYNSGSKQMIYLNEESGEVSETFIQQMSKRVERFTKINNLILEIDYYKE